MKSHQNFGQQLLKSLKDWARVSSPWVLHFNT